MVPILYNALLDPEPSVIREASLGLCILSRRPEAWGKAVDPLDDGQMNLKEDATVDERKAALAKWQIESKEQWHKWYQKIRPYDERDDKTALRPSKK